LYQQGSFTLGPVLSLEADTNKNPGAAEFSFLKKATAVASWVCPTNVFNSWKLLESQIFNVLSVEAVRNV
jgi:hypothetical protein